MFRIRTPDVIFLVMVDYQFDTRVFLAMNMFGYDVSILSSE